MLNAPSSCHCHLQAAHFGVQRLHTPRRSHEVRERERESNDQLVDEITLLDWQEQGESSRTKMQRVFLSSTTIGHITENRFLVDTCSFSTLENVLAVIVHEWFPLSLRGASIFAVNKQTFQHLNANPR